MEDYIQFSAKTKNEAITKACIELGASSDQLDIQVISEGSSGFFGFGSKPAIIKARKLENDSEEKEIEEIVDSVKIESIIEEKKKEEHKKPPVKEKPAKKEKEAAAPAKEKVQKEKPEKPAKEKPAGKTGKTGKAAEGKNRKRKASERKTGKTGKGIQAHRDPEGSGKDRLGGRTGQGIPYRCFPFYEVR